MHQNGGHVTITVFTTPQSPQCDATVEQFARLGIDIHTVDLSGNPTTFEQIRRAGYDQVPVVIAPDLSWSGYRPDLIRELARRVDGTSTPDGYASERRSA